MTGDTRAFEKAKRAETDASDLEKLNQAADELNAEIEDVLQYQATIADFSPRRHARTKRTVPSRGRR